MASIEKRRTKNGKLAYRVKIRRRGQPPISATFGRLTDARGFAQATEAAIAEGRHLPRTESRRHTLSDAIERYSVNELKNKRAHTASQQRQQLGWWNDLAGHLLLADVSPAVISRARDDIAAQTSNSTANRYVSALGPVLTLAVQEWEWLDQSPMTKVRKLREPRGRVRFLSDDEREHLLATCRENSNRHLYLIVVVALSTGARQSEITTLQWHQVDFNRQQITLHETKNDERRVLPLADPALGLMREHGKVRTLGCEWVFPGRSARKPVSIGHAWSDAVNAAGIEDFRFHDLRHTAASYLAMNGASLAEIAEILGHKTLNMVKRYAHLSEAHTASVVQRMNERYLG